MAISGASFSARHPARAIRGTPDRSQRRQTAKDAFRADPDPPYYDKNFAKDKSIIVYCASGGRTALAGKVLKDMGYASV
jgi:rhodanese-related sulfurtransferase